jgi:hypothetical protein
VKKKISLHFFGCVVVSCINIFGMDYDFQVVNIAPYGETSVMHLCDKDVAKNLGEGTHDVPGLAVRVPSDNIGAFIQYARNNMQQEHPIKITFDLLEQQGKKLRAVIAIEKKSLNEIDFGYRLKPKMPESDNKYPLCNIMNFMSEKIDFTKTRIQDQKFMGDMDNVNATTCDAKDVVSSMIILLAASYVDMFPAWQFPHLYKSNS